MYKRKHKYDENETPSDDEDSDRSQNATKRSKISNSNYRNVLIEITQNDTNKSSDDDIISLSDEDVESDEKPLNVLNKTFNEDGSEVKENELLKELKLLIKNVKGSGNESISGEASELPLYPCLFVKDYGHVPLPVNECIAENIIKLAVQSPYGFNEETLLDTKVRDSFEIEPSSIDIKHPEWNASLQKLADRVAKGLGCNAKIEAKLYKLLIYRKGGHFDKHRDTEKEKNMFATLVIQLPSIHEGGELIIYHEGLGTNDVYDFGNASGKASYTINFVAHYADVEHEVLEVKNGYRLALVYSLCWVDGNSKSIIKSTDNVIEITKCLEKLNESNCQIAITLDHKYTTSAFSQNGIKALKGIDNDRYSHLSNANARLPPEKQLNFYIAHAQLVVDAYDVDNDMSIKSGSFDESNNGPDGWEEDHRNRMLDEWYNIDGISCFNNSKTTVDFFSYIIDPKSKKLFIDLNKELSYGKIRHVQTTGYTGNTCATKITTYSRYLLFFWPKSYEFDTFLRLNNLHAIDSLYRSLSSNFSESIYKENLTMLVTKLVEANAKIEKNATFQLFSIFEKIKDLENFKKLINSVSMAYKPEQLINLILLYKWENIKDGLSKLLLPLSENRLMKNLYLVKELNDKHKETALECFKYAIMPVFDNPEEFIKRREHIKKKIQGTFSWMRKDNNENIQPVLYYYKLAEIVFLFDNTNIEELKSKYTNILVNENDRTIDILIGLLKRFHGKKNLIDFIDYSCLFKSLFNHLNPNSVDKLVKNCNLVKILCEMEQNEVAFECFNNVVLPVLDNAELFNSYNKTLQYLRFPTRSRFGANEEEIEVYYKLADTILLFKSKNIEEHLEKYSNLLKKVVTDTDQHILEVLLSSFTKREEYFCSSKSILNIYEFRLKQLNSKLAIPDKFTWSMPGSIQEYSKLDNFLRSENQKTVYSGCFRNIHAARDFVHSYEGLKNGYSLTMTASGAGRHACVSIVKTKEFHDMQSKKLNNYKDEFKVIENLLNKYKSKDAN